MGRWQNVIVTLVVGTGNRGLRKAVRLVDRDPWTPAGSLKYRAINDNPLLRNVHPSRLARRKIRFGRPRHERAVKQSLGQSGGRHQTDPPGVQSPAAAALERASHPRRSEREMAQFFHGSRRERRNFSRRVVDGLRK